MRNISYRAWCEQRGEKLADAQGIDAKSSADAAKVYAEFQTHPFTEMEVTVERLVEGEWTQRSRYIVSVVKMVPEFMVEKIS